MRDSGLSAMPPRETDIAIVGAGLSGSLAAVTLARAGHRVTLIDLKAEYPNEFRVEKIAGDQIEILERLELHEAVTAASIPFSETINVRGGRIIDRSHRPHLGVLYADLVGAVRQQLPAQVEFVVARVADLSTGPERQRLTLLDGAEINARLVILATGMGDMLRQKLGMERRVIKEKQSFSFGFNIAPEHGMQFGFEALTAYGERIADGIDYLSLFPTAQGMRANLFTFRDYRDPWIRALRQEPKATLLAAMPGLSHYLGDFQITDKVQSWLMDISVADNCRQAGVVLIGDAYQTSCPAAGTGVSRLLTDVEQLCRGHIPAWFATPGIGAEKIATFYDDPAKQEMDARAIGLSEYRRELTIAPGLRWALRRRVLFLRRRVLGWLDEINPALVAKLRGMRLNPR
jgi:2-polyprenyl-6-methoxyphenol hydroxylase-like FAD-dependent oxidoreductase